MNNYLTTQKILHRIALSSNFFKEIYFDLEKMFFLNKSTELDNNHVFISGMARSGTTILLNAIHRTNEFASLTYEDMPFILSPNFWSKLNKSGLSLNKQERVHGDGINIDTNSPEAFEEVFWKTFHHDEPDTSTEFINFVQLICMKYNKRRYLSKNNQNIKRINHLINIFPSSKIIVPFRDPIQHAYSLFSQHKKFNHLQKNDDFIRKYMFWIGHSEFGLDYVPLYQKNLKYPDINDINHWIEQWYYSYSELMNLKKLSEVVFICYEQLCTDNSVYKSILDFIEINSSYEFNFNLSSKKIELTYNEELYKKCLVLYDNMKISI